MLTAPVHVTNYDFPFESFFSCRHLWQRPSNIDAVARVGAPEDYQAFYESLKSDGVSLVHTPEMHLRCSELPHWYHLLEDLTPRSIWFEKMPALSDITDNFEWPVFMKGARQTSKHQKELTIIDGPDSFERVGELYERDPILRWQKVVCREFVKLRPVGEAYFGKVPCSFEFRTFWWKGELAGYGPYWHEGVSYTWTEEERSQGLAIAQEAARRIGATFVVIDIAQTVEDKWIVIESNDGQESGYGGVSAFGLWQKIIEIETSRQGEAL